MNELSQTPSGYSERNHTQNPQTLQHLLVDKTAFWIKSSLIFLFRDFTHGFVTGSQEDHIGALYFLWLVHTWRLEFSFQLFCVQNSFLPSQFWAYICSKAFLGCRLGRNETQLTCLQHSAQCSGQYLINCCPHFIVKGWRSDWRHENSPDCYWLRVCLSRWRELKPQLWPGKPLNSPNCNLFTQTSAKRDQ